jgi:CHAT domain-containing protein
LTPAAAAGSPAAGSGWSQNFLIIDAAASVNAALARVKASGAPTIVVARGDAYFYAFDRGAFLAKLESALPSVLSVNQAFGGLHETDSDTTFATTAGAGALPPLAPSAQTTIALDSQRVPIAVGSLSRARVATPAPSPAPPSTHAMGGAGAGPTLRGGGQHVAPTAAMSTPGAPPAYVSDGFAQTDDGDSYIRPDTALVPGATYFYWFAIAPEALPGAITSGVNPAVQAPAGARLVVALFALADDGAVTANGTTGVLKLGADGRGVVERQPTELGTVQFYRGNLSHRLFFPIRAPTLPGTLRLRSSVFYGGTLLQSRLIEARLDHGVAYLAALEDETAPRALRSRVDYSLARTIDGDVLEQMPGHQLSILANRSGDGTHGFTVYMPQGDQTMQARFDPVEIEGFIKLSRPALRYAAWRTEVPWTEQDNYRYADAHLPGAKPDLARLREDLLALAIRGAQIYDQLADRLCTITNQPQQTNRQRLEAFRQFMRPRREVQLALYNSARDVLPLSLLYDYPIVPQDTGNVQLCPMFVGALTLGGPLELHPCFIGNCSTATGTQADIVCPGGFWGFRHNLGVPLGAKTAARGQIRWTGSVDATFALSQDFSLAGRHEKALAGLRSGLQWHQARTLSELRAEMTGTSARQILYFYCHGGVTNEGMPWFRLGDTTDPYFQRVLLGNWGVDWELTQPPLVLLNGCRTLAVEPNIAIEFLSAFVRESGAAGVIGTDITIFEELAVDFAEPLLRRFLSGNFTIGESVRLARLDLLRTGNPLGLAYIPFVISGLKLVESAA